jgi:hypothetical protein
MNSLRNRLTGRSRQMINEPGAGANPLNCLSFTSLQDTFYRTAQGIFMSWPSQNHS